MQEQRQPEIGHALIDREKAAIRQLTVANRGGHVDPADAGQLCCPLELFEGQTGALHRQHGKAEQTSGMRAMRLAYGVVERDGQLHAQVVVGPVHHGLGEREHMDIAALPVHLFQPFTEVDEGRRDGPGAQQQPHLDEARARWVADHRRPAVFAVIGDQLDVGLGEIVGVDIDRRG